MPSAKITSKGQITIPKAVRDRLGLRPGDEIEFAEDRKGVRIIKSLRGSPFKKWRGFLKDSRGLDPDALVDEMRGR